MIASSAISPNAITHSEQLLLSLVWLEPCSIRSMRHIITPDMFTTTHRIMAAEVLLQHIDNDGTDPMTGVLAALTDARRPNHMQPDQAHDFTADLLELDAMWIAGRDADVKAGLARRAIDHLQGVQQQASIEAAARRISDVLNDGADPERLHEATGRLRAIEDQHEAANAPRDAFTLADDFIDPRTRPDDDRIASGVTFFDRATGGGLQRQTLTALAGLPKVGKSMLASWLMANHLMHDADGRVIWCAGEMSRSMLVDRIIAQIAGVVPGVFRLSEEQVGEQRSKIIDAAVERFLSFADRWHVVERPLLNPAIRARVADVRPTAVVIDYLQLVSPGRDTASEVKRRWMSWPLNSRNSLVSAVRQWSQSAI